MKKLAIIGASYLQLPLALKAKEMGLETHCFAWEEGAVCKSVVDFFYPISIQEKEQILEICETVDIDGIVSIASDVAVPTVNFVSSRMGLTGNLFADSLVCTDKYKMRKRFAEFGVSSPKFVVSDEGFSVDDLNFPVIVKPTDRSGSRGVKKIVNKDDLQVAVARAKNESFSGKAIIEEYISGAEVSVESISWYGEHYILTITDKVTTGAPCFVELEHHQPSTLSDEIQQKIKIETFKALNALNIQFGASHSEFKITNNSNVFAIEVGARMGGDFIGSNLVQLSTGFDFVKAVIDVALGQFQVPIVDQKKCSGVFFLCKETEYLLQLIQQPEKYKEILFSEITDNELHNIQCSADRSGYFIYQSDKRFKL